MAKAPARGPAKKKKAPSRPAAPPAGLAPDSVVVHRSAEIDPENPMESGGSAPLRKVWVEAAREARDGGKVVIDLIGEGRGVIAIPVAFDDEKDAMEAMRPALDVLVTHVLEVGQDKRQPVMVDLQELRERLKVDPEADWLEEHGWFKRALAERELLCMYVFSPAYLLEFASAVGEKQGFSVAVAEEDPGFYRLTLTGDSGGGEILWNWARAMGDCIAGGHAWSYFGLLLALAPQVAAAKRADRKKRSAEEE